MNISTETTSRPRRGAGRAARNSSRKLSARIDMTPMVDLGFLLIAFFVMTTRLSEPSVVKLNMHRDGPPTRVADAAAFSILLKSENEIYVYAGDAENAIKEHVVVRSSLSSKGGLRDLIQAHQRKMEASGFKEGRAGMMMLIKPTTEAVYRQLIDVLDEATINNVGKYVITPLSPEDHRILERSSGWPAQ